MNSPTLQGDDPRRGGGGLTPTEQNVISKHESFKHLKLGVPGFGTGVPGFGTGVPGSGTGVPGSGTRCFKP